MSRLAILTIALGFVIRLFCFCYTSIISPDGVLYIHQARAIYYGLPNALTSCGRSFLSNYPILIAGVYTISRDWVVAAKLVSLFFGTLTLVPLYLLSKRFFDDKISALVTLIFALTPAFINWSADAVRAPLFWFFSVLGVYLFINQLDKKNNLYLLLSSLSFLMATWARVEASLLIIVSCFYMLAVKQERKIERFVIFIMPVGIIMFIALSGLIGGVSDLNIFRYKNMLSYASSPLRGYEILRGSLSDLTAQSADSILRRFLLNARHLVWWTALGALLSSMVQTSYYPFFIVFVIGFKDIWGKIREDQRISYLFILTISAFIFLYLVILIIWEMYTRYMGIFVFLSFFITGFGLERIISFLRERFTLKDWAALAVLSLLILAFSLPKTLKPREKDKLVFKEIGQLIAHREGNDQEIMVTTSQQSVRWISFYANLNFRGAPCPEKNYDLENIVGKRYEEFVQNLRKRGIRYFLWEEKHWPKASASYIRKENSRDFMEVGTWNHPDTGKLILFKVINFGASP